MKQFDYVIQDELGLHARPAGKLVKQAGAFKSDITISKDGKSADLKRLFAVMGLAVKGQDTVTIQAQGEDEEQAAAAIEAFLKENV